MRFVLFLVSVLRSLSLRFWVEAVTSVVVVLLASVLSLVAGLLVTLFLVGLGITVILLEHLLHLLRILSEEHLTRSLVVLTKWLRLR